MAKTRFLAIFIFILGFAVAYFHAAPFLSFLPENSLSRSFPFHLGLDLQGGAHLVYRADVSNIEPGEVPEAMAGLRDVLERRINFFGVSEPVVQTEKSGPEERLIVELPGVTDVSQAIAMIGETPFLEFKTERLEAERDAILGAWERNERLDEDPYFVSTNLTGRYLKKATLDFNPTTFEPEISLEFSDEGAKLFAEITKENVGKRVAIYLDGAPISIPSVREEITSGRAQITGQFRPDEAKTLVTRLNSGALPIPITLISQQGIGASLGEEVLIKSINAGVVGILAVALFLIILYRFMGLVAVFTLAIYTAIVLLLYKIIPVTLTAPGIAGFILSIGVAVDANILIFERVREELLDDIQFTTAMREGFSRAWSSIRDSNLSTIITATILYWFGTSLVKGFALTLGIGVLVSLFSSYFITRTFLVAMGLKGKSRIAKFLFDIPNSKND